MIDSRKTRLDVDEDGETKPLTDGLLIIRYLFGFQGQSLVSGAVGPDSDLSDSDIAANLQALEGDDAFGGTDDGGSVDEGATDDSGTDGGASDEGTTDDGGTDEGTADAGSDDGSGSGGSTDSGAEDDGTATSAGGSDTTGGATDERARDSELVRQPAAHLTTLAARAAVRQTVMMEAPAQAEAPMIAVPTTARAQRTAAA